MIIAMAGHVDHGKTSLIRALTGIDTDRLPDEKARGMTIDLGFAHAVMPDGSTVGFVDVPGHERFLANMLAGVLAVDTALLVVAADDGPMPQTHEHLAILRLTGVPSLTAVLTKIDRVDPAQVQAATEAVRQVLARAGYADAAIVPVSSHTGIGIEDLRARIAAQGAAQRATQGAAPWAATVVPPVEGRFRMAIDRAFTVAGAGLVLTGTIIAGRVAVGDRLLISPSRLAARVRGVQVHHQTVDQAQAGDRSAMAIAGAGIEKAKLRRGDWLVDPGLHAPTQRLDVLLRTTEERGLRHARRMHAHLGAAAVGAKILVLGGQDMPPDQEGFVNLTLDRPIAALFGDRIILRDDSTGRVVGGGRVIDPFPPSRRVRRERRLATLQALVRPSPADALAALLDAEGWIAPADFARSRNLDLDQVIALSAGLRATRIGRSAQPILVTEAARETIAQTLLAFLADWHARHPDRLGPGKPALLTAAPSCPAEVCEAVLRSLLDQTRIRQQDAAFHLPDHAPQLAENDQRLWDQLAPILDEAGLRSCRIRELATALGLTPDETEALLIRLERFGRLLRVARNRFFLPDVVGRLGAIAADLARESEAAAFTAAEFNQRAGIGRNLTIEVLEFLDGLGVTQRVGELRHIVRSVGDVVG